MNPPGIHNAQISCQLVSNSEIGFLSASKEGAGNREAFLHALGQRIPNFRLDRFKTLADVLEGFPVDRSRFVLADLPRRINIISWGNPEAVSSGIREIINECITVAAGDCNDCMGDELIYMWDILGSRVVRHCQLCGATLELASDQAAKNTQLTVASSQQLSEATSI